MVTTINKPSSYIKLSIQISLDGLSFCILDQQEHNILYFKKINFEKRLDPIKVLAKIEMEYENEEELSQSVDEVNLVFKNSLFSLVPSELFDEDKASDYLKFNTKILKTDFIAFDRLNQGIINVYIPYANITNYFFDKYGEFEYRHSMSILIDSLLSQAPKKNEPLAYLHCSDSSYELIIIENSKLIFANSFEYETREDFLYYLLFTAEQLGLDPHELELVLLGNLSKRSNEYEIVWDYVKNVSFLGLFHTFNFDSKAKPLNENSEYLILKSF